MGHLITDNPVLSAAQKRILLELPESLRQRFVFAGGTALAAFHLQHRLSEDLDFFARQADTEVWGADIELSLASKFRVLTQERIYDRRIYHLDAGGIVKVEFVPLYFSRLQPPIHIDALWVEDLPDLAANKIMALADRFDIKDFSVKEMRPRSNIQWILRERARPFRIESGPLWSFPTGRMCAASTSGRPPPLIMLRPVIAQVKL